MRKLFVLPMVLAVFFADFGAFGATARGSRGNSNATNATSAPVAARAAVRGAKTASTTAAQPTKQNAPVAARAATRNAPKTTATASAGGAVAARAGAKQKVINMGTKVSTATANTVVSQECQDAYFGCMDSFCMLENVTGGRCKCSDKNAEYDNMLAEIMKLDQQSYVMQTEGVSLLKMGKSADEVYAMAESAANKVSTDKKATDQTGNKKLDLSAWDKNLFDDEEFFSEESSILESDLTNKTGDKLHSTAASVCKQQIPTQCSGAASMLQMMYVQKIQSDCAAYENSLKQQQLESNQKLQTARQSLRDAALEKYQESNKYDLGGCVRAFNSCMQQENVCGEGFLGCVSFAATDNLKNNKSGTVAKQTTIRGSVSSITLAATTMDELLAKRVYCDSVLEQCVSANKNDAVWTAFLKSAAPAIKTAESDVESNLRMNCVKEVSECFQTACKEQMDATNEGGSYDMCLSNPDLYKSFCKPKLEPCLLATGGTYDKPDSSSLWVALLSRLASMKVDACTQEVKSCLLSEDRCGKDYAGCIGLSTYEIGQLCPTDKLTACRDERKGFKGDELEEDIRAYVEKVAQGIALNIDNNILSQCQSALKTAMLTFCGSETECPNAMVDESIFDGILKVKFCKTDDKGQVTSEADCYTDLTMLPENEASQFKPMMLNKIDVSQIQYAIDNIEKPSILNMGINTSFVGGLGNPVLFDVTGKQNNKKSTDKDDATYSSNELRKLQTVLNNNYKSIVDAIESDPKVSACMSGRQVQGFGQQTNIGNQGNQRFPNLTQNVRRIVAKAIIADVPKLYLQKEAEISSGDLASMQAKQEALVKEKFNTVKSQQDGVNLQVCQSFTDADGGKDITPEYNPETATCTLKFYEDNEHKGDLTYQFPLVNSSNWQSWSHYDESAVRYFVHPNGFKALKKSEIKKYNEAYGK